MTALVKPEIPLPTTDPDDARIGHLLGRAVGPDSPARVVLIGFPSDEGVRRNGGRVGAAGAPTEIRRAFYRLTPDARSGAAFVDLVERTVDLGDLRPTGDLDADQVRLGEVLAPHLDRGTFVIVLGGGHETAYGHFLGYARARKPVHLLNWDAHADVRPLKDGLGHSGSPFRQALQHPSGMACGYRVAGLLPQSVAAAHLSFVERRGRYLFRDELSRETIAATYDAIPGATLASFDIDAVDGAEAPGVSSPSVGGMPGALWLEAAYLAGRSPQVTSVDLVETNPAVDRDGQTVRLAAMTIWSVLRGLASRG